MHNSAHLLKRLPRMINELEKDSINMRVDSENLIATEALNYLGRYIPHKFNNKRASLGFAGTEEINSDWKCHIKRKILYRPSSHFLENLKETERLFQSSHGTELKAGVNGVAKLIGIFKEVSINVPDEVMQFFP